MSGPFKVGDVVVCVDDSPYPPTALNFGDTIALHAIYRVKSVGPCSRGQGLVLFDVIRPGSGFWFSGRFRHLPKADEQFTAKIRACRPIKLSVDA